jgi:hypothetical protein
MRTVIMLGLCLFLIACATHLVTADVQTGQAVETLAAAGYRAHESDDAGADLNRYQAIYCGTAGIMRRGKQTVTDGGVPCPKVSP